MIQTQYKNRPIPQSKKTDVLPKGTIITFVLSSESVGNRSSYEKAKQLQDHIEIIAESREAIVKGDVITLDEFKKDLKKNLI